MREVGEGRSGARSAEGRGAGSARRGRDGKGKRSETLFASAVRQRHGGRGRAGGRARVQQLVRARCAVRIPRAVRARRRTRRRTHSSSTPALCLAREADVACGDGARGSCQRRAGSGMPGTARLAPPLVDTLPSATANPPQLAPHARPVTHPGESGSPAPHAEPPAPGALGSTEPAADQRLPRAQVRLARASLGRASAPLREAGDEVRGWHAPRRCGGRRCRCSSLCWRGR